MASVQIWAQYDAAQDKSALLVMRLDANDRPVGRPLLLRYTSGEIEEVAAAVQDGHLWIAWLTRRFVAVLRAQPDLSQVSDPVTPYFPQEGVAPRVVPFTALHLSAYPAGMMLANKLDIGCRTIIHRLAVDGIIGNPTILPIGLGECDISVSPFAKGVQVSAIGYRGGKLYLDFYVPYDPAGAVLKLTECDVSGSRDVEVSDTVHYWNGTEIVTLCKRMPLEGGERCPLPIKKVPGYCPQIHVMDLARKPRTVNRRGAGSLVPLTAKQERCIDGRWMLELFWKGGQVLVEPEDSKNSKDKREKCPASASRTLK